MRIRTMLILPLMIVASSLMAQERTRPLNPSIDSLFPSRPTAYLTDMANIVRNATEVNTRLAVIRGSNQLSLVAVTLPSLGRFDVADVAREIGRSWMVATRNDTAGAAVRNTGGVILISMSPRKCRVEVATGSEGYMTDMRAANACRNAVAALRAGDFGNGIISIANEFVRYHNEELADQAAARVEAARPKPPFPWNAVITIVFVLTILCLPILYVLNKRQKELDAREALERQKAAEAYRRAQEARIAQDKIDAQIRRERERAAMAKEKARWDALTPEQQKNELRAQELARIAEEKRQMAAAERRRIEDDRRRKREAEEEEERRRHRSYYSNDNYSSGGSSHSSDSGGSSWSSGGSDSFSGGGGGSDF